MFIILNKNWFMYLLTIIVILLLFTALFIKASRPVSIRLPKTVVIDAGHGGMDPGSSYGNLLEKDINLEIAFYLQDILENEGFQVIMTRTDDTLYGNNRQLDLQQRLSVINNADAHSFVSIHVNKFPTPQPFGGEVYYHPLSTDGQFLAQCIQDQLLSIQKDSYRTIKKGNFYILKRTNTPGVIVEIGFISNSKDRACLQDTACKKRIARAIARGITDYFRQQPKAILTQNKTPYIPVRENDILPLHFINPNGRGLIVRNHQIDYFKLLQQAPPGTITEKLINLVITELSKGQDGAIAPLPNESVLSFYVDAQELVLNIDPTEDYYGGALMEVLAWEALERSFLSLPGIEKLYINKKNGPAVTFGEHLAIK